MESKGTYSKGIINKDIKILVIEDDFKLSTLTREFLNEKGFLAYEVGSFLDIENEVKRIKPNLIILDINLPYLDGYYICREIRREFSIPIIITSARNREVDQILALEIGADDYLSKPYSLSMLYSKIMALLRRSFGEYAQPKEEKKIKGLVLDEENYMIRYQERAVELSKNEMKLLKIFLDRPNQILKRSILFEALWENDSFVDENTLTVNISRIKGIFKKLGVDEIIQTKRGVGYILDTSSLEDERWSNID